MVAHIPGQFTRHMVKVFSSGGAQLTKGIGVNAGTVNGGKLNVLQDAVGS